MLFAYGTSSIWNQLGKLCAASAAAQKLVQYSHSLKGKVEREERRNDNVPDVQVNSRLNTRAVIRNKKRLTVPGDHHFLSRRLVSFGLAANHSGEITKLATVPLIPGGGKGFLPAAAASDFLVFLVGNGGALRKAASMDEALFSTPFTS